MGRYISLTISPKNSFIESLLNKLFRNHRAITIVYTDSEFAFRKDSPRLWWNTPLEIPTELDSHHNFAVIENPIQEMQTFLFYPILRKNSRNPQINPETIVFIGEVSLPEEKTVTELWNEYKDTIMNDLTIVRDKRFWDQIALDKKEKFDAFIGLQNFIRIECIRNLRHRSSTKMVLIGEGWKDLGFTHHETINEKSDREQLYAGALCLDLGSKSGVNSLYQRSIEVIESGGILLQALHPDSISILGSSLSEAVNFSTINELNARILDFEQNVILRERVLNDLASKFSNYKENYLPEFSKIVRNNRRFDFL